MQLKQSDAKSSQLQQIATSFVGARQRGQSIDTYPGEAPSSLDAAYAIQNQAIDMWSDEIAGWKVGRITGDYETALGVDRLAGPIFKSCVHQANGRVETMPVFQDGFAAVEGEIIVILGEDAPADKTDWTTDEVIALIGSVTAGIEIASSPFSGINDLGPLVTISDFGNNFGLIIGEEIPDWKNFKLDDWRCETIIDGQSVGVATPAGIPGGPVESVRFLLELSARRGLPLKKGMAVSTGAVTGVHVAHAGQSASVSFNGVSPIKCELVGFSPTDPAPETVKETA